MVVQSIDNFINSSNLKKFFKNYIESLYEFQNMSKGMCIYSPLTVSITSPKPHSLFIGN